MLKKFKTIWGLQILMTNIPPITPGRITALWHVLKVAVKYTNIKKSDLLQIANNTSLRGGGLPIDDGLDLAITGGFIKFELNIFNISSSGREIVSLWDKEEPNPSVIRTLILPLVLKIMPSWVTFALKPLEERIFAIPERWKEILRDAELLYNPLSQDSIEWWKALEQSVSERDEQLKEIVGEAGEKLTMKFERERLLREKHFILAEKVRWVSKESDKYGFDISSNLGFLKFGQQKPDDMIMIEVKSTTSRSNQSFRFFLTRNEWETAEKNIKNYLFYLWNCIEIINGDAFGVGPIIIPAHLIRHYIPLDKKDECRWTECRIDLNLKEIMDYTIQKQ